MPSLPPAVASFDAPRFLGTWFIIATNYGFWKRRTHPTVTYGALPGRPLRMTDRLCFEARPLLGRRHRPQVLEGVDRQDGEPGRFVWRGKGLFRIIRSPWCVVAVGPAYEWAVTYFARSNVGTAEGVDIYARSPCLPPEQVADILREVRASAFMAAATAGMFETVQKGVEPGRYRLG
jgi:lipocalin